jgi:hypothetical protein
VKIEASPPRQLSSAKKLAALSFMQTREAVQDRMHRLIENSPSDHPSLRSPDSESSKIYFILYITSHVEASKDTSTPSRQAKTKVIKKEPQPKKWSPSHLRLKRYPPDSQISVPP